MQVDTSAWNVTKRRHTGVVAKIRMWMGQHRPNDRPLSDKEAEQLLEILLRHRRRCVASCMCVCVGCASRSDFLG